MYQPDWDPSCPEGGNFYACGNGTRFVGCCEYLDPCAGESVGCSAGNLRPTSFDPLKYGTFQDQECNAAQFYTCAGTSPPFFGCCESNPCQNNGCPSDDLAGAYLSNNPQIAAEMDPYPPVDGSSSSTSTFPTASPTASSASSGTSAATSTTMMTSAQSRSVPVAAIAGASVGGFVLLCAIIAVIWLVRRHIRNSSAKHNRESRINTTVGPGTSQAYGSDAYEKTTMAGITPTTEQYRDSPSTIPPYSGQNSPNSHVQSDGWNLLSSQQQGYAPIHPVQKTEAPSQYKPYSPNQRSEGVYSQYLPSQAHFPSSPSQSKGVPGSTGWNDGHSSIPTNWPIVAHQSNHGFARIHKGPAQEMGVRESYNGSYQNLGLGVYHTDGGNSSASRPSQSRAELDSGRHSFA